MKSATHNNKAQKSKAVDTQEQTIRAITRYVRMSPLKMRQVARTIQGLPARTALEQLKLLPLKAGRLIAYTLASAIANAENNHNLSADKLIVHRALIDQGPVFKRFRPAPRGSAHPYIKSTSHIQIVLI